MQTFPYVDPADAPSVGSSRGPGFATEIVTSRSGVFEQRRITRTISADEGEAVFGPRENARALVSSVEAFFKARKGMAESFVLCDFDAAYPHVYVYAGTTNGARTVWDLPCRTTATGVFVYLDGAIQLAGLTLADTGANGRKRVTFTVAPAAGKTVTASFTGQRAFVVRFKEDTLRIEPAANAGLYSVRFGFVERPTEE